MLKRHCEHCDLVIPDDVKRWTLRVGVARKEFRREDEEVREFCAFCITEHPAVIVRAILGEDGWGLV